MVRVGSLSDSAKTNSKKKDSKSGMNAAQQLDAVFTAVRRMQPAVEDAFHKTVDALAEVSSMTRCPSRSLKTRRSTPWSSSARKKRALSA